jgi:hypothetical protein
LGPFPREACFLGNFGPFARGKHISLELSPFVPGIMVLQELKLPKELGVNCPCEHNLSGWKSSITRSPWYKDKNLLLEVKWPVNVLHQFLFVV